MWCRNCNIELKEKKCPICGSDTVEDTPVEIAWCGECQVPVLQEVSRTDKGICPRCGGKMKYMSSDIRPVFPEERLLLEILLDRKPNEYLEKSVWAVNSRYYIDGKSVSLPSSLFKAADADIISRKLDENKSENNNYFFKENIEKFIVANAVRLNYIKDEAYRFVKKEASKFLDENVVISFSGGKDSTATADLVIKALSNPNLVHIFGDTTLEFQQTIEYARRYREEHPQAIFKVARNNEQVFLDVCKDIGPPARMMRWCCSMF